MQQAGWMTPERPFKCLSNRTWTKPLHLPKCSMTIILTGREADSSITGEALAIIQGDIVLENRKSTVIYQPHWHKGVIGIVASRLMEHYYRPTIVLTKSGEVVSGSARSIPGFNIHEGLHQCQDLLLGFGGHYFAAGMTMKPDNVFAFAERFEEIVSAICGRRIFHPGTHYQRRTEFRSKSHQLFSGY